MRLMFNKVQQGSGSLSISGQFAASGFFYVKAQKNNNKKTDYNHIIHR